MPSLICPECIVLDLKSSKSSLMKPYCRNDWVPAFSMPREKS